MKIGVGNAAGTLPARIFDLSIDISFDNMPKRE
jgi:hypothetical protein